MERNVPYLRLKSPFVMGKERLFKHYRHQHLQTTYIMALWIWSIYKLNILIHIYIYMQYICIYMYIYNGYESPLLPQQTQGPKPTSVVDPRPRGSDHPRWPNLETARRPGSRRSLRASSELELGVPNFPCLSCVCVCVCVCVCMITYIYIYTI